MKKGFLIFVFTLVLLGAQACAPQSVSPTLSAATPEVSAPTPTLVVEAPTQAPAVDLNPAYLNAAFVIEGTPVTLVNGLSEVESAPGSAGKVITRYFGNDSVGDLNADGKADAAFLLTHSSGGSGSFYYVVAALQTDGGYAGTNGIYLGDRIATQDTRIENGVIVVNYAERKPEEPFAAAPTVPVTRSFQVVDGKLVEMQAEGQITNRAWQWARTQMNDDTLLTPRDPQAFTLTFEADGSFHGTTDCNSFFGSYQLEDNRLTFGPIGQTKMFCQDSQESEFLQSLSAVDSWMLDEATGELVLLIKLDSGSMVFE